MKTISVDEFIRREAATLDRVVNEGEEITIELGSGERAVLSAVDASGLRSRGKTEEDYAAFLASAGSWTGVDIDAFLVHVLEYLGMNRILTESPGWPGGTVKSVLRCERLNRSTVTCVRYKTSSHGRTRRSR